MFFKQKHYLADGWSMPGRCLVDAWSMPGRCLVDAGSVHAWSLPGLCLVDSGCGQACQVAAGSVLGGLRLWSSRSANTCNNISKMAGDRKRDIRTCTLTLLCIPQPFWPQHTRRDVRVRGGASAPDLSSAYSGDGSWAAERVVVSQKLEGPRKHGRVKGPGRKHGRRKGPGRKHGRGMVKLEGPGKKRGGSKLEGPGRKRGGRKLEGPGRPGSKLERQHICQTRKKTHACHAL